MGDIVKVPDNSRVVKVDLDYKLRARLYETKYYNYYFRMLIWSMMFEQLTEYNGFLMEV